MKFILIIYFFSLISGKCSLNWLYDKYVEAFQKQIE